MVGILVDYTFRPYNPLDGHFISRDPIGEDGGLNLYGFAGNDPVNRFDVLGLEDFRSITMKQKRVKWLAGSCEREKSLAVFLANAPRKKKSNNVFERLPSYVQDAGLTLGVRIAIVSKKRRWKLVVSGNDMRG
jgi:uncharacterized protein RhaS with RHS repeats